ncbi:MAG TPA: COX15/CtaA family protein [Gemmatimonadaceae bacterium]|nr:COX15/CtaA family protein [Gemmatimonadaceae bacterium]
MLRRLSYVTLALAYLQIVFGAIVRITGSGLGCGNHWPDCYGSFAPTERGLGLLIEISHRYGAAILSTAVFVFAIVASVKRDERGVGGPGGVLRAALAAAGLVVCAALLGAATVKLELNPALIVSHLAIAISLLGVLSVAVIRTGGFGAQSNLGGSSDRTSRAAMVAVALGAFTLVLGALTANIPSAPVACGGFPWCRTVNAGGTPLVIQIIHRTVAFLLFGHLWGVSMALPKRNEPRVLVVAARLAFGLAILQILIAAAMVEMHLPLVLRSLHQATGTLVWLAICVFAGLSRVASPQRSAARANLVVEPA